MRRFHHQMEDKMAWMWHCYVFVFGGIASLCSERTQRTWDTRSIQVHWPWQTRSTTAYKKRESDSRDACCVCTCSYLSKLVRATCSYKPDAVRSEPHLRDIIHVEGLRGVVKRFNTASISWLMRRVRWDLFYTAGGGVISLVLRGDQWGKNGYTAIKDRANSIIWYFWLITCFLPARHESEILSTICPWAAARDTV